MKRRNFFVAGLFGAGTLAYSLHRGLRMPPFIWQPRALPQQYRVSQFKLSSAELIRTKTPAIDEATDITLRAFTPEPSLVIRSDREAELTLSVNNLSPRAELHVASSSTAEIDEQITGITRILKIRMQSDDRLELNYRINVDDGFKFAAIGDTGGRHELAWSLQRAQSLGALFLLHLGDFHYAEGDYESAINHFNNSPIPTYVSIGNHDFHDGKTVYQKFLDDIGPFNSSFVLGKAKFINLDTASSFLPWSGGQRGALLEQLKGDASSVSNIAFTHRPLYDPIENSSHDIGNYKERDWLISELHKSGIKTLLSGHIHIHARQQFQGIDNIIVGQGLGHQDLITDQDYSKIALGEVDTSGGVEIEFAPLSLPWEQHCHPRHDIVKDSLSSSPHAEKVSSLTSSCKQP